MAQHANAKRFVLCIKNRGYAASLETRKIYCALKDDEAESHGLLRVVDESGEDYLYAAKLFVPIDVPTGATRLFGGASA